MIMCVCMLVFILCMYACTYVYVCMQVVKLGSSSETTRLAVTDGEEGDTATAGLLADYSVTPAPQLLGSRTPRTPATQDIILQVR